MVATDTLKRNQAQEEDTVEGERVYFRQSAHGRPLEKQEGNWVTTCGKNRPGEDLAETGMSVVSSGNRQAKRPTCPKQGRGQQNGQGCGGGGKQGNATGET